MGKPTKTPSGTWRAEKMIAGKRHSKTFKLRRDAAAWLRQVEVDSQRGVFIPPDRQREKVSDRLDAWLDLKASDPNFADTSLRRYRNVVENHIRPRLGHYALEHLTVERVEQWRNDLVQDESAGVAKGALGILSSFLSTQERHGYVPRNIAKLVEAPRHVPKERPILEPWELHAAVGQLQGATCAVPEGDPEWELRSGWSADVALGLALVGCRIGDLSRLTPESWDRVNERLFVRDQKTGNDRWIPVFEELRVVLERCVGRGGDLLFMADGQRGQSQLNGSSWGNRHWHPALDAAGIRHVRPHDLRHFTASFLIRRGFHAVQVAAYLGHSSVQTTLSTYAHLFQDDMKEMGDVLDEMWKEARSLPENVTRLREAE